MKKQNTVRIPKNNQLVGMTIRSHFTLTAKTVLYTSRGEHLFLEPGDRFYLVTPEVYEDLVK